MKTPPLEHLEAQAASDHHKAVGSFFHCHYAFDENSYLPLRPPALVIIKSTNDEDLFHKIDDSLFIYWRIFSKDHRLTKLVDPRACRSKCCLSSGKWTYFYDLRERLTLEQKAAACLRFVCKFYELVSVAIIAFWLFVFTTSRK